MKEKTTDTAPVLDFGALPYATHARLTVPVTILKGKNPRPCRHITLSELLSEIETTHVGKLNHTQSLVCAYEQYLQNVEKGIEKPKKAYEALKDELYGFQLGNFSYRSDERANCLEYVPCLVFDIDGCASTYDVFLYQQKLKALDSVFACFASPSGYGLRILIWTNSTYETHQKIYLQILEFLCQYLDLTLDKRKGTHLDTTCKNESRHFYYVAVDSKAFYLNLESKIWERRVETSAVPEKIVPPLEKIVPPLEKKGNPKSDNISTYIDVLNDEVKIEYLLKGIDRSKPRKIQCFYFGCVCHENNVDFENAKRAAFHAFYDSEQKNPEKVIESQLKDGYNYSTVRYNDSQFIAFLRNTYNVIVSSNPAVVANEKKQEKITKTMDLEKKYPSPEFYARLPKILRQCTDVLVNEMDKHVFFNGSLSTLSSLMGAVSGIYDGKKLYPSFYTYIVATGGAGKGALDYARQIVLGVARKLQENNEKKDLKRTLFLPTNIGNTQFVQKLHENKGVGLFFETEGCMIAKMSKSENMDLSDTLRKGYHHEMLLLARKTEKLDIEIPILRLSVLISGTLSQLFPTIKDGEDGLLSRFNYLFLSGNYAFKNVFDREQTRKMMPVFNETSEKMVVLYELLQNRTITFEFTEVQEEAFVAFFKDRKAYMMDYLAEKGEYSKEIFSGIMNRIGVICFRVAMILTVLRYFEEGQLEKTLLICKDDDFKNALDFSEFARNNALSVFNKLPTEKKTLRNHFLGEDERVQQALKLKNAGLSYSEIAKILLGDENKKSTVAKWFTKKN
jgi:Protein of unknown function (DUF3987)/VirE N-terminal domain